jgi:alpha-ribazole phosphatase
MKLWLLRHAQPLVDSGVCYGALDVAADEAATHVAAQGAAQALPPDLLVWHSPLQRC